MASRFTINPDRFAAADTPARVPVESLKERLRRSSWKQDVEYIKTVDNDIAEFDAEQLPLKKRLETIKKVILAAMAVIVLLTPLGATSFAAWIPAWLPWGVGLPTLIIFEVLHKQIDQKIEFKKHHRDALLLMRGKMEQHSFKSLHPLGEWDLPAVDRRLKSDLVVQEELKKKHPEGADRIERLATELDLDVSPMMKLHAARTLAQIPDDTTQWGQIVAMVIEAKNHLRNHDIEAYKEKMEEAKRFGLCIGGSPPDIASLSPPSAKTEVRALVGKFQYFNQFYRELYAAHEEGKVFLGPDFCESWENYLKFAGEVQAEIEKLIPLFEDPDTSAVQWSAAARYVEQKELDVLIATLIEHTRQLQRVIQLQIKRHPVMRIEAYKAKFTRYDSKMLQADTLIDLGRWIDRNPDEAKRPLGEAMQDWSFAHQLSSWLEQHPDQAGRPLSEILGCAPCRSQIGKWLERRPEDARLSAGALADQLRFSGLEDVEKWLETHREWIVDPVSEIYDRNYLMRFEYQQAFLRASTLWPQFDQELSMMPAIQKKEERLAALDRLEEEQFLTRKEIQEQQELRAEIPRLREALDAAIRSAPSLDELGDYQQRTMLPLKGVIGNGGEPSNLKHLWRAVSRKLPAHPFEPVEIPKAKGFNRSRKIEELIINDLLKQVDRQMVHSNRIKNYGLEWAAISVVMIVQVIFWSNPWVVWGGATVTLLIKGLSLYMNHRLRNADKKKQGFKLQSNFHNHPNLILHNYPMVTRIPGSYPVLQDLRDVQQRLDLDGGTRTWARVLSEGNEALKIPRSREEAKAICREVAKEGSEKMRPVLERRLVYLLSLQAQGDNRHRREIRKLQDLLYPPLPTDEKPLPTQINTLNKAWNEAVRYRMQVEKGLEEIKLAINNHQEEVERYERAQAHMIKIGQGLAAIDFERLKRDYGVASNLIAAILTACEDNPERPEVEGLDEILVAMHRLFHEMQEQGESEELKDSLAECIKRLRFVPVERLHAVIGTLQAGSLEMQKEDLKGRRLQHRQEVLTKRFSSFDLDAHQRQIRELTREYKKGQKKLAKSLLAEKQKGVRVAMEKQLPDTRIEEKRKALYAAIKAQGDQEVRKKLQRNLIALKDKLGEAKDEFARALVDAETNKRPDLIAPALEEFKEKIFGLHKSLANAARSKRPGPLRTALENQVEQVKGWFQVELRLAADFEQIENLNEELKTLVLRANGLEVSREPSISERLDTLLNDKLWEEHLDTIRELYLCLNSYQQTSVWWRLPDVFREEQARIKERSREIKAALERALPQAVWERDEDEIKNLFGQLTSSDQAALFTRLPQPFQLELNASKQRKIELEKLLKKFSSWERNEEKIRSLFENLLPNDQNTIFAHLPEAFRKDILQNNAQGAKSALARVLREGDWNQDKNLFRHYFWQMDQEDREALFERLPPPFQHEIRESRSTRARDELEKILDEGSLEENAGKIRFLYSQLSLRHKNSLFSKLPLEFREELV